MPELASKHKSSNCRPFENINIHWDGLQFVCVSLSQSLLKTTSYPIADHAEMLILVETFFNFYALAYDFKTELRRCSLGRGHELNENFMPGGCLTRFTKNAHPARTHRALTAHSKNGVMWPRGPWSSISSMRPWEHLVHGFRVSFYTLWEDARNQNWSPGSASIQRFYSDLHGLRGCQATELTPCKCPHSMFLLRFTHFERMLGDTIESLRVPPSMFILCLRFESIPGNKIHLLGMPSFNVSIAFHMLWEGAVAENWFPGSGHIQCFYCSCFERILGNKADSLGVPTFYFIVFYMFWEDAG